MVLNLLGKPKLFLTYDSHFMMDGVGAQLQRIISIFGIAKLAKVGYLHTPISNIDKQIFLRNSSEVGESEIRIWNQLFARNLEEFHQEVGDRIFKLGNISLLQIYVIRFFTLFVKHRVVLRIGNPRTITDKFPDSLLWAPELFDPSFLCNPGKEKTLDIVVHIRQGVLALTQYKERLLPLAHYENILEFLVKTLTAKGIDFKITVLAEDHSPSISLASPEIRRSIELDSNNPSLKFNTDGTVNLEHEIPDPVLTPILHRSLWLNGRTAYADFFSMVHADILIISKSSFSFVAGLLNKDSVKVFSPFWHEAPKGWLSSLDFNEDAFANALEKKGFSEKV